MGTVPPVGTWKEADGRGGGEKHNLDDKRRENEQSS